MQDAPYTAAHHKLRRQLHRYKWSLAELQWLAAQIRGNWPRSLQSLIYTKLAEAERSQGVEVGVAPIEPRQE